MDLQEAIAIASQMKGHFRTFEKLEEVIQQAIAAEKYLTEVADRTKTAKAAEDVLTKSIEDLSKQHEAQISIHTAKMQALHESHAERLTTLANNHDRRATELEGQYQARLTNINNELAGLEQRKHELESTIGELESKLASAQAVAAELKARL